MNVEHIQDENYSSLHSLKVKLLYFCLFSIRIQSTDFLETVGSLKGICQ